MTLAIFTHNEKEGYMNVRNMNE